MPNNKKRRIAFLTGTRADFGKIKSLIRTLRELPPLFEVHIFATGMHMEPLYGYTVEEIEKSGFSNIYRYINQSASGCMDAVLARTVAGFGDYVRLMEPDMVVVHGDRVEALAGALVGSLNNTLVAHIEGGEVSGTIDELIRHSVSKMSHLHFVSNAEAERRLVQLGEERKTIHVIGSPDVDIMGSSDLPELADVKAHYEIPFDDFGILVFHPVTTSVDTLQRDAREVVAAVRASDKNWIAIYPNSDSGSALILAEYERELRDNRHVRIFPSVRFEAMLVLLRHATVVLGNSSMGVREAPYYGTPTVNVGTRQNGRSDNPRIINVAPDRLAIQRAIVMAAHRPRLPVQEFGCGQSHVRFRRVLESEGVWKTPVQKRFVDLPMPYDQTEAA